MKTKKNKLILLLIFIVPFCCYNISFFCKKNPVAIPVTFGAADIPLAPVEIQGNTYLLEVDLGSKFPLSLNPKILENLEKTTKGTQTARDMMGNTYAFTTYLLNTIKLKELVFNHVLTNANSEDYVLAITLFSEKTSTQEIIDGDLGTIGRPLFADSNIFLDFPHSQICICNDISDLQKFGYSIENFITIPLVKGRTGWILQAETDLGKTRFSLDTGSTLSFIRQQDLPSAQIKKDNPRLSYVDSSRFIIGDQDFGSVNLHLLDITPELHEIDGLLGMDFLKKHPIYIDPKKQLIYVLCNETQKARPNAPSQQFLE